MNNNQPGGWAGKILHIDLTNYRSWTESTEQYHQFIGGMGIGYKVLWDAHKDGAKATDASTPVVLSAGPLSGSGAICTGRTTITSLNPVVKGHLITDGHFGGHFSPALKYAGYDAVVVVGQSKVPVWVRIEDDVVTFENGNDVWGKGMFDTFKHLNEKAGANAQIAAIGPAGENRVPQSTIQTQGGHSAGGHGAVFGSKKLKAIAVVGTGAVKVAASNEEMRQLDDHILGIIGANNNGVVPNQPQSWAEHHSKGSRWRGGPGVTWGTSDNPIEVGETPWNDKQKVGFRTSMAEMYFGREEANKHMKRAGGCHSCPIRCFCEMKNPRMKKKYKLPTEHITNVCLGFLDPWYAMGKPKHSEKRTDIQTVGGYHMDDMGVWSAYGQLSHLMREFSKRDFWKQLLPAAEYQAIDWQAWKDQDASVLGDFYQRLALGANYQGSNYLGRFLGAGLHNFINEKGQVLDIQAVLDGRDAAVMPLVYALESDGSHKGHEYNVFTDSHIKVFNRSMVGGVHHASESAGQVGALLNTVFNRDPQCHSHINLINSGLPHAKIQEVAASHWGEGAFDKVKHYTAVNPAKAKFAKWCLVKNVLHDSLTVCNWVFPLLVSPDKNRSYLGDSSIEAQMFTAVTGISTSEQELDHQAESVLQLHRALTILQMNNMDQRASHDVLADWVYDMDPTKQFGDEGTIKMDRADMVEALDLFYVEMGWDKKTGAPTRATLTKFGLGFVADELAKRNLLPA
ncbi:aldehyde ferredoxin oxidoreductase [Ferrimonas lipolytica]|uniref:Aldehyde ferredoxin oxidoreductase n=1 Tax=Ferrimonas lipolytica TaxID=2724191 RepID=A0A6H1UEA2_9GAMM|nr:aldehyde ferredoxin oxidoreductase [Ferrimonas lipolytica]QIZ76959.1 aldehyde ferredoxin oxidoreductase [Ferrimonas lipolytica]